MGETEITERSKKLTEKEFKNVFLVDIVSKLNEGKSPVKISKELNISMQKLSYHMRKLKEKGLIIKKGYGTWETKKSLAVAKEVRGHGFMWHIEIDKKIDWAKELLKNNFDFKIINSNKAIRIILKDKKIWLNRNSIIIYDKESYFDYTPVETRRTAVHSMLEIINLIKNKVNLEFNIKRFKVSRQHYALIKNNIAIQCDKEGCRINVFSSEGLWFVIDNSYNLHEAEAVHPKTALIDSTGLQNYLNSHKNTNWKVTPEFLLQSINQVTQNQLMFAKNIETHMQVLQDIRSSIDQLTQTVKKLEKYNNKSDHSINKSLFDF